MRTYQKVIQKKRRDYKYLDHISHKFKGGPCFGGVTKTSNDFFYSFQPSFTQYADPMSTFSVLPKSLPPGPRVPPMQIGRFIPQPHLKPLVYKPRGPSQPQESFQNEVQFIASNKGDKKSQKLQKIGQKRRQRVIQIDQDNQFMAQMMRKNKTDLVKQDDSSQMPRPPLNPFFIYLQQKRVSNTINFNEFGNQQTRIWNSMTPQQKQPYIDMSQIQKKQYERKLELYKIKFPETTTAKTQNQVQKKQTPKARQDQNDQQKQEFEKKCQYTTNQKQIRNNQEDLDNYVPMYYKKKQIGLTQILPVREIPLNQKQQSPKEQQEEEIYYYDGKPTLINLDD